MGSCPLKGLPDGSQLCPCYNRLVAKSFKCGCDEQKGCSGQATMPGSPVKSHAVFPLLRIIIRAGTLEGSEKDSLFGQ